MIGTRIVTAALALVVLAGGEAHAQTTSTNSGQAWPQKPVHVIVPFPAGGSTDAQARIVSERLSAVLGQQFLVENRAGAGGAIAAEFVARAPADGYTLFFAALPQISTVPLVQKVNYDPFKDFAPISIVGTNALVLVVHISIPVKTIKELVDYVKARPGQMNYASAGTGTLTHLAAALFLERAGLQMTHVPYKGSVGPDLVGGHVQMNFGTPSDLMQHSKGGKIRLLAVSSEKRMPQLPDLPAIAEYYPGFRVVAWNGYLAPASTPKLIIDRLAQEIARIVREPATAERLFRIGVDPLGNTPAEFAGLIRADSSLWRDAVNAAGIKPE
jgi:tripartite-type tricarboxylate transporter receptor subunit TctC